MRTFTKKPKATQQTKSAKSPKPSRSFVGQSRDVHSILHLQRTIGNQAVLRLLQTATDNVDASSESSVSTRFAYDFSGIPVQAYAHSNIQPKLKVNAPRDRYEQEADRIADEVLQQNIPEKRNEKIDIQARPLQPATGGEHEVHAELENRLNRSKGGGSPISDQVRAFFEPRLHFNFSKVQVHTDNEAARMNQELGARAFTHGRDIYFGVGQYDPQSIDGKRLLAHELAHVIQQRSMSSPDSFTIQRGGGEGMGPCSVILETLVERPMNSDWPLWLKIAYAIVSPLWVAPGAAAQFLCYEIWHYIFEPISSAWQREEELPLTEDNFMRRVQEELAAHE